MASSSSSSSPEMAPPGASGSAESPPGDNGNASPPVDNGHTVSPPVDNGNAESPPGGNGNVESPPGGSGNTESPPGGNGNAESPPSGNGNTSSPPSGNGNTDSPPGGSSRAESPPSGSSSSPPPSPPQAPPRSSTPSTPTTPATSPPSADPSPSLPVNNPVSPPPSSTPRQSPPNNADSPPAPSNSNNPPSSAPQFYPPPSIFSPPSPNAGSSQLTPSVLSPSPPHSSISGRSSGSSAVPTSSTPSSDSSANVSIVAGIVGGGSAIIVLLIACLIWSRKKKKEQYYTNHGQLPKGGQNYPSGLDHVVKLSPAHGNPPVSGWGLPPGAYSSSEFDTNNSGHHPMQSASPNVGGYGSKSQFTFDELSAATNRFSEANVLGQGGFGFVHKGVLPDGKEVAVKSLKAGSGQGEREFQAEVEIISRVHHRHLVSLVGYCIAGDKRLLVYEFVPNKTLEFHLHGNGQTAMDWPSRLRIARGSAKGLAYLHEDCEPRIIHRDIKSANILLDSQFEAKVADFGLAKLTSDNYTHVSTRVMGTFGYLAPEYAASGKLSEKSDVFSFGVMLLELITGRRPVDPTSNMMEDSLVDWARALMSQALEDGEYTKLVDPRLEENYIRDEMAHMVACASACVRHSARRRPRMSQVVRALEGDSSLDDLNGEAKTGQTGISVSTNTNIYDTRAYNADLMKFKKMILPTQEFDSSESSYNPSSSTSDSVEMEKL